MTFRGSFDYTLDSKNRLTIPAKFRATFADGIVLALRHDTQSCISVWRSDEFDEYVRTMLSSFHLLSTDYATLNRFYNSHSHEMELDSAGRVMVPAKLIEQTGLDKEVVVTGAGQCLEVWDRAAWTQQSGTLAAAVRQITERITEQLGHPA
jgi:MraZ protein